jgi:hypothetical protein
MRGATISAAVVSIACAVLAAGCGSGDGKSKTATQAASKPAGNEARLAKPIYASCGVGLYTAPHVGPAPGREHGWEVTYQYPAKAPRAPLPDEATTVDILEEPPFPKHPRIKGGHDKVIAGRQVSMVPGQAGKKSFVAEWTTSRARYIILFNGGKEGPLDRIIGCLP